MVHNKFLFFSLCFFTVLFSYAQRDSVVVLDEVVLTDAKLSQFSVGNKKQVLKDSVLSKSQSFTDLLRYNSTIYFKENGYGMVSSPSFRGTNAQQTAVIWNGININSQLNGQTDFNTVVTSNYNNVTIKSGGGSVQYGSGAIGGSIHLNSTFNFKEHLDNEVRIGYGSFNTQSTNYKLSLGSKKFSLDLGVNYNSSNNDYKYLGTDQKNENGAYENGNVDLSLGYLISDNNILKLYHNTYLGSRDFSGTLLVKSNENYKNTNVRTMLEWSNFNDKKISRLKLAHLYERYRYYANKDRPEYAFGYANSYLFNYDYKYTFSNVILNGIVDHNYTDVIGRNIEESNRSITSLSILMQHKLSSKFKYTFNVRKDYTEDFSSPFLFVFNGDYSFSNIYNITLSASKNYRIPTFNDMYWVGAGNKDLVPETSKQVEIGNYFKFKNIQFNVLGYYTKLSEMIQWRPISGEGWIPVNVKDVTQYGAEAEVAVTKQIGKSKLVWLTNYAYTKSIDDSNDKQLMYVPLHKVTSNLAFSYKKIEAYMQLLRNGLVYTTTDSSRELPGYTVANLGMNYEVVKTSKNTTSLGLRINNLFNKEYQNTAFRPMPNRNLMVQLTTKF
ncbi:TonB-dependent receptor plug domain-containing protein [Cellulophaga fucicola]|uniref:Iron complex outermembrane recepter protein n=1 Tax=Cellulophaga fucicola TaxID=76595 RepID=A0A1K1LTL3_9FLAO|nr:TonB-dependent receptor [Cellulophaga fucicola]SFW14194.1 iron complex outermembrane recepter protein [Cellulophaga fucicola]